MSRTLLLGDMARINACEAATVWVTENGYTHEEAWKACTSPEWMMYYVTRVLPPNAMIRVANAIAADVGSAGFDMLAAEVEIQAGTATENRCNALRELMYSYRVRKWNEAATDLCNIIRREITVQELLDETARWRGLPGNTEHALIDTD
jgi:hypothetical protein